MECCCLDGPIIDPISSSQSHLKKWKEYAVHIVEHLDRIVGVSKMTYLDGFYGQFTSWLAAKQEPHEVLGQALAKLDKIEHALQHSDAAVLQEAGIGPEFSVIYSELIKVCHLWQHVEEMLCEAMPNPDDLTTAHSKKQLSYQCV